MGVMHEWAYLDAPTWITSGARVIIMLVGFTLAMACVKFAYLAGRQRQAYRGWGLFSYGLFVMVPAIGGLFQFNDDLNWVTAVLYVVALAAGVMALRSSYTLDPLWRRHQVQRESHARSRVLV